MAEKATILIPDISGFTSFTGLTEIDHAAHIINELLELIVQTNPLGFTLAEIEGDAVLFYLKEESPDPSQITKQCLDIFKAFHTRLRIIERDTVCQCGACQTASHLTLKFIIHFGEIKEIRVAQFIKATGIDMIIAHRLLKNNIPSDEYILITNTCFEKNGTAVLSPDFVWSEAHESYATIGKIPFRYALLADFRDQLPSPPELEEFVMVLGDDNLEVEVQCPLLEVYQTLINVDARKDWMQGVDKIDRDPVTERVGMKHNCQFMGMTMINTCLHHEYSEKLAIYVEKVEVPELSLDTVDHYQLNALSPQLTRLRFNIHWKDTPLPDEMKQGMLQAIKANLESFKRYLEA